MFNRKKLIVVSILLLAVMIVPSFGASFKKMNDQQFLELCKSGSEKELIDAINKGVNVNAKDKFDKTALMEAAYKGHTEIVNALIKAGAEVNAKDNNGRTALMFAETWPGNIEIVNALIKAGADVNAKDVSGGTALISAVDIEHTEAVNVLVNAGADVNAKERNGGTALIYAAFNGYTEVVNTLIDAGAEDLSDNDGKTALIHAARSFISNPETINALIDAGAYVKAKDKSGKMAIDYARETYKLKGIEVPKRLEELSR